MIRFVVGFALGILTAFALLVAIGHFLAVEDPLASADAIVALSGDQGARTQTAVGLWHEGRAPLIVFAGGSEDPLSPSSAELMKREAVRAGVPAERIIVEPSSASTQENARRVRQVLDENRIRTVILVTSPFHQRRASWHFARQLEGSGVTFRNYPARDPSWDRSTWWAAEPARTTTLLELAKLGAEVTRGALRRGA